MYTTPQIYSLGTQKSEYDQEIPQLTCSLIINLEGDTKNHGNLYIQFLFCWSARVPQNQEQHVT